MHFFAVRVERVTMSSQMFCELAALDTAELAKCGGDDGKVHRVTAGVVDSRICSFANDAPAGCLLGMYVCMYNPRKLRGVDLYPAATGGPARAYPLNRF
jgi:hypothetical protein